MTMLTEALARRVNLGVTGLSRSGKTVFITSLVHNLLRADEAVPRNPLRNFDPFDQGRLIGVTLRHDTDATIPEFPYAAAVRALTDETPTWPTPTEGISRLRLDIRYRRGSGLFAAAARQLGLGEGILQLGIVDYPGEWLVDLPMMDQDFETWSAAMLRDAGRGSRAALSRDWLAFVSARPPESAHDEEWAERAAQLYADYLRACARRGLRFLQPGRLLNPAELRGAAVLRFCPLPLAQGAGPSGSLHAAFQRKYADYRERVVRAFYRNHFAGLERQVVLVDVLTALNDGAEVFDDMSLALSSILQSFRHGRSSPLAWLTGRRIDRVLFAATKADHVVRGDRVHLENLTRRMLHTLDEDNRIKTAAGVEVLAIAAIRSTEDMRRTDNGREILKGRRHGDPAELPLDPGGIPLDFPPQWDEFKYRFWDFQPQLGPSFRHSGFPNIKLAETLNFVIGEDMR
jgi:predicted YcjX-like family ATPase